MSSDQQKDASSLQAAFSKLNANAREFVPSFVLREEAAAAATKEATTTAGGESNKPETSLKLEPTDIVDDWEANNDEEEDEGKYSLN